MPVLLKRISIFDDMIDESIDPVYDKLEAYTNSIIGPILFQVVMPIYTGSRLNAVEVTFSVNIAEI